MKILIVDDSEIVRERVRSAVGEIPHADIVGEAATIDAARASIRSCKPEVIVLDIRLPDGTGIGFLKEIKRNTLAPVVIVFTNYDHRQYRNQCANAGAAHYFVKSKEFRKLIATLETLAEVGANPKTLRFESPVPTESRDDFR